MSVLQVASQSNSSDCYYEDDDSQFLEALNAAILPGDVVDTPISADNDNHDHIPQELEPPPASQPSLKRRYSQSFSESQDLNEEPLPVPDDDVYGAAHFGNFGEYMRRKRAKLQIQNAEMVQSGEGEKSAIFKGISIYVSFILIGVKRKEESD